MVNEEIIKKAFELGIAVSQSDEAENLRAKQEEVKDNQGAYDLILRYQDARTKIENKVRDGLTVTQTDENHLRILEQQLNNNSLVQELIQVQKRFDDLMQAVYFAINQALSGNNCSAGCDSCGGGCQ
ncbi:MAG: YlbF family regulator [Syntrophomonadaceae bacterium]|nr:YlbF family regulator [Syntrophomonadaceae bacterium]